MFWGGTILLIALLLRYPKPESTFDKTFLAVFLLIYWAFSFVFAFNIKCPKCHKRWWWDAIVNLSGNKLTKLTTQESCPFCGFDYESVT